MRKLFILIPILTLLIYSCQSPTVPKAGDPSSDIPKSTIHIHRYEKALFSIPENNLRKGLEKIYPEFRFFMGNNWQDTMNLLRIYNFVTDPNIRELNQLVALKYPDTAYIKTELEKMFGRIREYYPEVRYPETYTYVSGLDVQEPVMYFDSVMIISLDLFLGREVEAYAKAGIPQYLSARFNREELLPSCARAVADSFMIVNENNQSLLDQMVNAGKVLYFMDQVLPDFTDEHKIGYTSDKLEWCKEHEGDIWAFLVANQLLFTSDPKVTGKLMVDAPFTSGFDPSSPGRLGEWVGWQIVRAYMKSNTSVTLPELMKNTQAQGILERSGYRPRK